ncbi:hypothetical protein D0T11_21570, partial [Hymenobacter rubripertinctus]
MLAIACIESAWAQSPAPCDVKGISTAPVPLAINPEYPTRTNTFNWYEGQQYNGRWWNLNNVAINEQAIWMPWEQTDNTSVTHILGKRDLPKDGWELLKRDMGYNDAGSPVVGSRNPYVVLYNKHTGMLRVFVAMGDLFNSYQFAEIKLRFNNNGAQKKAGTLNRMEGIGTALENTTPGLTSEFVAMVPFLNQRAKWFMADFPMEYDPCACQFDSKFTIDVNLVSQADVKLTGVTTGTLVTTDVNNPGATQASGDFNEAIMLGKRIGSNIKSGQKSYKSLDSFASKVKKELGSQGTKSSTADSEAKKNAIDRLKADLAKSDFLKNGLRALPYIGAAVSTLDAFFGGGKEESDPQKSISLQPMTLEMTTQTTGTISATSLYQNITFNNPGTKIITTPEEYPYYNEALGVLSVLRKPVVEVKTSTYTDGDGRRRRLHQYRVPDAIQYLINPASGLDVQDFQVALLQEGSNYPAVLPAGSVAWYYEGMSSATSHVMRTDYIDAGCLSNSVLELEVSGNNIQDPATKEFVPTIGSNPGAQYPVFLKFMLNLRRRNASATTQNVLLVLKFPVALRQVTSFSELPVQPCGVLP